MNRKLILSSAAIALLITVACSCGWTAPRLPTPGAPVTDQIEASVPTPALSGAEVSGETRLTLVFGAGKLYVAPGADGMLAQGTATYNYNELEPTIETSGNSVRIQAGENGIKSLPGFGNITNIWDLKLGDAPMELTVEAGGYEAVYELGGLALTNLTIKDGAADVKVTFSEPNLGEMAILRYETGASTVKRKTQKNSA